jgi:uncharacterized membrane protein
MIIQIIGLPGSGKNASLSVTIAFWETVVKVFIYYAHERGWNYIQWGRKA